LKLGFHLTSYFLAISDYMGPVRGLYQPHPHYIRGHHHLRFQRAPTLKTRISAMFIKHSHKTAFSYISVRQSKKKIPIKLHCLQYINNNQVAKN